MAQVFDSNRLAICSWSLQPENPEQLFQAVREIGIPRLQLALDPLRLDTKTWGETASLARQQKISLVSGMFGTVGEDYTTMESIRRTGGIVPDETWDENWENIQKVSSLAADLQMKVVSFHAGFLPEDEHDPGFEKLLHRLRLVADVFAARGIDLALETGQESAPVLKDFLTRLGRKNVGVNFDPANMILYDKGDPIEALEVLAPFLKQCHLKDANKTTTPGSWGDEVPVGKGQVDWRRFFSVLTRLRFQGFCCIEREAGTRRLEDIRQAREFVERL